MGIKAASTQREQIPARDDATLIQAGYKQSEFGLLPNDWDITTLGALGRPLSGGTPRSSDARFWDGDIPWVSSKDMKVARLHDSIDHVTLLALSNGTRLVPPGTLLMVVRGMSLVHSFPVAIVEKAVSFNQDLKAFMPHPGVSGEFVLRWLEANQARILSLATEATHGTKRIPTPDLLGSSVPLPPPSEQRAIAETLSDVDGLLQALEALIAKKRAIKQAAMQQLLTGKTRLPGFKGSWTPRPLGDVADIQSGGTPSTRVAEYWDGSIPWCTPTDITKTAGKYLDGTERRITQEGLANCAASLLPPGALLLCSRATIGEVKISRTEVCTNQGFKSLVCREGTSCEFLYYLVLTLKRRLIERASGSTFLEIGKHDVASITAAFPDRSEQDAIATVLSDMDAEIAALERRRDKTRAIKQGMMQQLLTGRVRLIAPEPAEATV